MVKMVKLFFVVFARDRKYVVEKIKELEELNVSYMIVCGERMNHPKVMYRAPRGKYDAINFAERLIPEDVDIVMFNDVDARLCNFQDMLSRFKDRKVAIVFASELVREGPQYLFFKIFNPIRRRIPLAASGELMMVRHDVLSKILPLEPCKAEDTYMMFKVLELGYRVVFCEECYTETMRTKSVEKEELYKRKTVTGIYQALSYTKPPRLVKLFYVFIPLASLLLLILGRTGYYWMRGIVLGFLDYVRGDRSGFWESAYMD